MQIGDRKSFEDGFLICYLRFAISDLDYAQISKDLGVIQVTQPKRKKLINATRNDRTRQNGR